MKKLFVITLMALAIPAWSQKASDIFKPTDYKYVWLGIDFSHVKLIGDFSQFGTAGEKSVVEIRRIYFPGWNNVVVDERKKYDIAGMLRKDALSYDIDMVTAINATTVLEELEAETTPKYTREDIEKFLQPYDFKGKEGIGIVFIAETLNKQSTEAFFHFVAVNMSTKEILIHERIKGEPRGIGLRNYWAGAVFQVIEEIRDNRYKEWKAQYGKKAE